MLKKQTKSFAVSDSGDGFHSIALGDYEEFAELIGEGQFRDYPEYIFRGHRDPSWSLLPSLYRQLPELFPELFDSQLNEGQLIDSQFRPSQQQENAGKKTAKILKHFLYGLRGTAWHEPCHEMIIEWFAKFEKNFNIESHINDLRNASKENPALWSAIINTWAIGRHHGLWTPLLDWTESPLVAFYFAFEQPDERAAGEESRVVYALNRRIVEERCKLKDFHYPPLDFVTPFTRHNPRLIAQQGLFTYSHLYQRVEDWVRQVFKGEDDLPVLIRIWIRNVRTKDAVRWLNRAGINDRNLFPDLEGISDFSNRALNDERLDYI